MTASLPILIASTGIKEAKALPIIPPAVLGYIALAEFAMLVWAYIENDEEQGNLTVNYNINGNYYHIDCIGCGSCTPEMPFEPKADPASGEMAHEVFESVCPTFQELETSE